MTINCKADIYYRLNQHISNSCRMAGQELNVLKIEFIFIWTESITIVVPLFNSSYCPRAWHFPQKDFKKTRNKNSAERYVVPDVCIHILDLRERISLTHILAKSI